MKKAKFKLQRPNKQQMATIAKIVGGLVLAFGAGIGLFFLQRQIANDGDDNATRQADIRNDPNRKPEGALEESAATALKGDYQGAQQQLESELAKTEDAKRSHDLLMQQAVNALNKKEYAAALKYAKEAIMQVSDFNANYTAAQAAERLGQKAAAKGYYETALAKYDKNDPLYESEVRRLKADIERMNQ